MSVTHINFNINSNKQYQQNCHGGIYPPYLHSCVCASLPVFVATQVCCQIIHAHTFLTQTSNDWNSENIQCLPNGLYFETVMTNYFSLIGIRDNVTSECRFAKYSTENCQTCWQCWAFFPAISANCSVHATASDPLLICLEPDGRLSH